MKTKKDVKAKEDAKTKAKEQIEQIDIETSNMQYIEHITGAVEIAEITDITDISADINSLFDDSALTAAVQRLQTASTASASASANEQSIFGSNKLKNSVITSTYLIDTVVAMSIKMSIVASRSLTVEFVAQHCRDLGVLDKFNAFDVNLLSKLTTRIRGHLQANNSRKKSLLYNKVSIINNVITVHDDVKRLSCTMMI